ncbi:MAG TPA: arsenosugar biosynthesis radical SAM (seleno)protein ArsS [bacterium]|nr:arsenosugar biosynthesis radical SAM (seleno)protein ArsS [bacterium]
MNATVVPFEETLKNRGLGVTRLPTTILQVNVGKLCDLACLHCHVEAGPNRTEIMDIRTAERVLDLLKKSPTVRTVDLTGGAPELNPNFRSLVQGARSLGREVIDRCNLTVLFVKGQEDTAAFLREQHVKIVASLPCYSKENVEAQRGKGVFDKSLRALILLNELGYGREGTGLEVDLVYNPVGTDLPPPQAELEADYKEELRSLFGIEFNRLFTITNMPIKRFLHQLERDGKFQEYMDLLAASFNPQAALGVMCRDLVSISWDGRIYDCDFNQMLEIPIGGKQRTIWEIDSFDDLASEPISFDNHCYGCAAGAGSSCTGALTQ